MTKYYHALRAPLSIQRCSPSLTQESSAAVIPPKCTVKRRGFARHRHLPPSERHRVARAVPAGNAFPHCTPWATTAPLKPRVRGALEPCAVCSWSRSGRLVDREGAVRTTVSLVSRSHGAGWLDLFQPPEAFRRKPRVPRGTVHRLPCPTGSALLVLTAGPRRGRPQGG